MEANLFGGTDMLCASVYSVQPVAVPMEWVGIRMGPSCIRERDDLTGEKAERKNSWPVLFSPSKNGI